MVFPLPPSIQEVDNTLPYRCCHAKITGFMHHHHLKDDEPLCVSIHVKKCLQDMRWVTWWTSTPNWRSEHHIAVTGGPPTVNSTVSRSTFFHQGLPCCSSYYGNHRLPVSRDHKVITWIRVYIQLIVTPYHYFESTSSSPPYDSQLILLQTPIPPLLL